MKQIGHQPERVLVELEDTTSLLDLTAAREVLKAADLMEEESDVSGPLWRGEALSCKHLRRIVWVLRRVARSSRCHHGQPLLQDLTLLRPLRIRNVILAAPSATLEDAEGELTIRLELDLAFGSGRHPTTQLCMEALLDTPLKGLIVADATVGSGVISILAARLGARSVTGVDVFASAVANAAHNVALNGLSDVVQVRRGSMEALGHSYDVAVANAWNNEDAWGILDGLAYRVRSGGVVITRADRRWLKDPDYQAVLETVGLSVQCVYEMGDRLFFRAVKA